MKNLIITEEEKNQILSKHKRRILNEQDKGEVEKSWDDVKDLKMELLKTLKTSIGKFESDPNIDLCDIMTQLHFDLTNFYNNPYVRKKGWDPRNCTNFSQLDNLMKEN